MQRPGRIRLGSGERRSIPTAVNVTTRAVPPSEMNGSGSPVIGSSPTTPPMLITAWPTNQMVIAAATKPPERVIHPAGDPQAGVGQHGEQAEHHTQPTTPSSSAITAKMKSLWPLGSQPHFSAPAEPDAEPAAVRDRVQTLEVLVAAIGCGQRADGLKKTVSRSSR